MTQRSYGRRPASGLRAALLGALACLAAAACGDSTILEQEAPSRVEAERLNSPANAGLLVNSAVGDFECALAQYVVATGLVGDELVDAQLAAVGWDYDRRTIQTVGGPYATSTCEAIGSPGLYAPLSVARFQADDILRKLEGWTDQQVPKRDSLTAIAAAFAGHSLLMMAEVMCSSAIDQGPELTPAQLFTEAETRFTRAIAAATASNSTRILNLARIGRARARRGLIRLAEARADAALVPAGFVYNATYSTAAGRRENRVSTHLFRDNLSSVDPSFRNVTAGGAPDPRVAVVDAGINGFDRATRLFRATKYSAVNSPIPIARYEEAQLIVAEADIAAGNVASAVAIINARRSALGLPAVSATDAATARTLLIEERRRELFLEGRRLGDLIRYQIVPAPAAGTAYPKGGTYGTQLCFPLPDVERNNNPNISGGARNG